MSKSNNTQKKELEEIYNKIQEDNKSEGTLIYNELLFMLDTLDKIKQDINNNGTTEHFIQGKQNFMRESPSLQAYNKLMKTYDIFYKNLINLLPKEMTPSKSNFNVLDFDSFCIEYEEHLKQVDAITEDNKKQEYRDYLSDPKLYDDNYNDFECFI